MACSMPMTGACGLAVSAHDPEGNFLGGLTRLAPQLRKTFANGGALVTAQTHPRIVEFLTGELNWVIRQEPADGRVGRHRRAAVALALETDATSVLYSDLDHILRWLEAAPNAVTTALTNPSADFVVIGRSDTAMIASPARLRDTERLINHIYELHTGRQWDLMFAIRRMSHDAARAIIEYGAEDSIANDVEWPLLAEQLGYTLGYLASDQLSYRARQDFDADADRRDHDPAQWITRIEIAHLHAQTMKRFITP